ncbi:SdpI family protein [Corynebacterium stationis]|uniref:SdpI family protein n=1 Tax=Corynebacterium stationis TaxID=1705 RepID=UPI00273AA669|nr:SdpI family protein [Corynebacterium stationis]WLP87993.1 SdpI family protein [Corynebacterium stationis]
MATTFLVAGSGLFYISDKIARGQLPMNSWVGLRTPKLMASDEAWIQGHKAASGYLKFSGSALAIFGVLCLFIEESAIGLLSIPVIIVPCIGTVLANQKANAAITQ